MSNARKLAANLPKEGQLSGRNLVINGAMEVAQRGTSQSSAGYGSVDRFLFALSGGTGTMSQQYQTVSDKATTGFAHYLKVNLTAGNNNAGFYHKMEAREIDRLQSKKLTLSFWAKGTNPGGGNFTFNHYWYDSDFGDLDNGVSQTFAITSTWTKYSITFDVATNALVPIGNNPLASYEFAILQPESDTSTNAWRLDITGLMLEAGEKASPFEYEPYDVTLEKCQRYFQTSALIYQGAYGRTYGIPFNQYTAVNGYSNMRWWKMMRVTPTITMNSLGSYNIYNTSASRTLTAIGISQLSANSGEFYLTTGSLTQGTCTHLNTNGDNWMWKADAEIG